MNRKMFSEREREALEKCGECVEAHQGVERERGFFVWFCLGWGGGHLKSFSNL